MKNSKADILTDMDGVLVHIDHKWIIKLYENDKIKSFLDKNGKLELLESDINNFSIQYRQDYSLNKHYGLDTDKEISDLAYSLYFDDPKFYDDLPTANYLDSLLMTQEYINSITVISHTGLNTANNATKSKAKWLINHFKKFEKDINTKFILCESSKSKSKCILENDLHFDSFVDDSPTVIQDVAANIGIKAYLKEFMIPVFGYNAYLKDEILPHLSQRHNTKFIYFENHYTGAQLDTISKK